MRIREPRAALRRRSLGRRKWVPLLAIRIVAAYNAFRGFFRRTSSLPRARLRKLTPWGGIRKVWGWVDARDALLRLTYVSHIRPVTSGLPQGTHLLS